MKTKFALAFLVAHLNILATSEAEAEVLVVENATLISTEATLTVEDEDGTSNRTAPPEGKYGKDPAVAQVRPGQTARISAKGGADLVISGEATARLEPGTVFKIPKPEPEKKSKETDEEKKKKEKSKHTLSLLKGSMFITVDSKKLKKRGKKEFRLKTPKSVLAVKGTRFVSAVSPNDDTVVLLRGSVEARDDFSQKSGTLRAGRALDIGPEGALTGRVLNDNERGYQRVFDLYELAFRPFALDYRKAESRAQFFPDRGTWVNQPDLLGVSEVEEKKSEWNILRLTYKPEEEIPGEKLNLSCDIPYSQPKLKSILGILVTYRSSAPLKVYFECDFMEDLGGTYRIQETASLKKSDPAGGWNEIFLTARFVEGYVPGPGAPKTPELKIVPGHLSQWPGEKPVAFALDFAPVQTVAHGKDQ